MKLYIFRHGEILNPNNLVYLRMDQEIKLSETGKKQIVGQSQKLQKTHPHLFNPSTPIYHSPLLRTTQTAKIISQILNIKTLTPDKRLLDVSSPAQGMPMSKFTQKYQHNLYHPQLIKQGGETIAQVGQRMQSAFLEYSQKHPHQNAIGVSHGDPIRIIQMIAQHLELNTQNMGSDLYPVANIEYPQKGSLTIFEIQNQKISMLEYWPPIHPNTKP